MFSTPKAVMTVSSRRNKTSKASRRRAMLSVLSLPAWVLLTTGTGCLKHTKEVAVTSHAPLIVDEAMQRRQWPRTVARFQNGETPATPTGFLLQHNPRAPKWAPALTDGPLFVANIFAIPVAYAFTPAWQTVIYPSGVTEPSYNAMPQLPPERK